MSSSKYQPADGEFQEIARKLARTIRESRARTNGAATPSPPNQPAQFTFRCQSPMDELSDAFEDMTLKTSPQTPDMTLKASPKTLDLPDGGKFVFKSDMFSFVVGSKTYTMRAGTLVKRSSYFDKMINGSWMESISRTITLNEVDFDVFDAFFDFLETGWYDKKFVRRLALPDQDQRANHKAYPILLPEPSPFTFGYNPPQTWLGNLAKPPVDPESYSISFHLDLLVLADYYQVNALKWSVAYHLAVEFREAVKQSGLYFKHARARVFAEHVFGHPYPYVAREVIAVVAALTYYWRPSGVAEFDRMRSVVYDNLRERDGLELHHISALDEAAIMQNIDRRFMGRFWREIVREPDEDWL